MATTVFSTKPFLEIVAGAVERVRLSTDDLTDFNVGSVTRALLEAHAIELEDYYQAVYAGLTKAIPISLYIGFGFERLDAVAASGVLTLTRTIGATGEVVIPAGERMQSVYGQIYTTSSEAVIAEEDADTTVIAVAVLAGSQGNALPGEVSREVNTGIWSATNLASFSGGRDAETDEQRALRFALFVKALARGTPAALEYAATIPDIRDPDTGVVIERVQRAAVAETPGHVNLHVHNGAYGVSDALLLAVQALIDGARDEESGTWEGGYRPAGMRVDVVPFGSQTVSVSAEVERDPGATAEATLAQIQGALEAYLNDSVAGTVIRPKDLGNVILSATGVFGVSLEGPTTSVVVPDDAIMALGDLVITWTE